MEYFKIFNGKKVLVTGHTGFKGSWLSIWLNQLGAEVYGLADRVPTDPSHYSSVELFSELNDNRFDIRDERNLNLLVEAIQPDFVFHLAAQPLVRLSYEKPIETISVNAIGTANLLESLRGLDKPVVAVMITSDKSYDNLEWTWGYRETDRLGGKDPYSASKGMAELAIKTYLESYFSSNQSNVRLGIARAGNVIGGGDWAIDRIVPDCMQAWSKGKAVDIRSPYSTRPWQHVLEPLSGYLALGASLAKNQKFHGEAYNFGPPSNQNYPVSDLIEEMSKYWEQVRWNDVSKNTDHLHEAGLLKLNCDKALHHLSWRPVLEFKETVRLTVNWYKSYYEKNFRGSMNKISKSQIDEYTKLAKQRRVFWAL